jgi:GrpB-like predicted nucleotidyltransferase (UPF0157 family)
MDHRVLGLRRGTVALKGYTKDWASIFEHEAGQLRNTLGRRILAVEHIGSTSIPGMAAKPILDMMVGVRVMEKVEPMLSQLINMGYQRRTNGDLTDRVFLVKGPESRRTHHLSITVVNGLFWKEHILFRDALRADGILAGEYLDLKRRLAKKFSADRNSYTAGKEQFVRDMLSNYGVR